MDRRSTLKGLGAAMAVSSAKAATRPNILLIVVDDMRFDEFGAGGHPYLKTPAIDRLAAEGVSFAHAFHATPLCSPNRACILTGEYASRHGIYGNVSRERMSRALRTMTKHLHDDGYETAHVGKWHMGDDPTPRPGYDFWVSFPAQGKIINPDLWEDGRLHAVEGYVTDLLTDRALKFLAGRDRAKPFFLYLGHKAVHPDVIQRNDGSLDLSRGMKYIPEPKYAGQFSKEVFKRAPSAQGPIDKRPQSAMIRRMLEMKSTPQNEAEFPNALDPGTSEDSIRARAEMMLSVDDSTAALLARLQAMGDLDNTVVVFTSDNGFFFGEHGLSIERRLPYEESIRMPILLRYPAEAARAGTVRELTSSIDIAPTLLDIAGIKPPAHIQGRSMRRALDGRTTAHGRVGVLTEYYSHDLPMPWTLEADYRAIRTNRFKLIEWTQHPELWEVYDIRDDPFEMTNLAGTSRGAALRKGLSADLLRLVGESVGL